MFAIAFAIGAPLIPMRDEFWVYEVIGFVFGGAFLAGLPLVLLARKSLEPQRLYGNC